MEKITNKQYYLEIKEIVNNSTVENKEDVLEFIDKVIALIDNRAAKAKIKAAEKRAAGDELREAVQSILTGELQTADAILVQIQGEDLTKAKIVARLTQLVKAGIATKEEVKTDDNKKVMAYKLV